MFNEEEHTRYRAQMNLATFGQAAQHKLKAASVLVIGAGGLGSPVCRSIAAMGIGGIGIVDADTVSLENLHRQSIYHTQDVGKLKVDVLRERLHAQNPHVRVETYPFFFTDQNADIVKTYPLVIDATDNAHSRYVINDACVRAGIPFIFGGIYGTEGRVGVLNYQGGPTYRCLFPEQDLSARDCSAAGALISICEIIANLQCTEAVKILTNTGKVDRHLRVIDVFSNTFSAFLLPHPRHGPMAQRAPYTDISPRDLYTKIYTNHEHILLVDVRETQECVCNPIPHAQVVPLSVLAEYIEELSETDQDIYFICEHGVRSRTAATLVSPSVHKRIFNVVGGRAAYHKYYAPTQG